MKSICGRLLAILFAGLAVTLAVGGFAVYQTARSSMTRQLDDDLRARSNALQAQANYGEKGLEFEFDQEPDALPDGVAFVFRDEAGSVVRQSEDLDAESWTMNAPAGAEPVFSDVELPGRARGRAVTTAFLPRIDVDEEDGPLKGEPEVLILTAAIDRGPTDRALAALCAALLIVGIGVAAVAAALVVLGVRWGLAPLARLANQVSAVGGETISPRFDDARAPSELAPVYHELNGLLDRVERTIERERLFADAAAHELRTPLAELRAAAEAAIRWPDSRPTELTLRELLGVGWEMEQLVESLLQLSRAQASRTDAATGSPTLRPVIDACFERERAEIELRRLRVKVSLNGQATLGSPGAGAIEIIIRNLVDNAVHHTPPGGEIEVRMDDGPPGAGPGAGASPGAGADPGAGALVIANRPVDLSAADLQQLFDPFWRKDAARTDRRHVGLGLAVVRRLASASHLRIDASLHGDQLEMRLRAEP